MKRTIYILTRMTKALLFLIVLAVLLPACDKTSNTRENGKLKIVTTTGIIKDAVQNIVGDEAEVVALMGPGVDPHLYKASHGDLEHLTSADVILYNGLHLEGKMGEVLEKLAKTRPVVAVSSGIAKESLREIPGFDAAYDPHIWFDVELWRDAVSTINKTLVELDTVHKNTYGRNTARYLKQLDSLHEQVKQKIREIPKSQRVLITAHDAFGYFGDAYEIEVRGLQGISTVSEFGLRDVTELVNFIINRKIKAVFVETSVSEKSIEAVVEGCRQKDWNVNIGGSLYSDALGMDGTPEGTYIGMVNSNVQSIVSALK